MRVNYVLIDYENVQPESVAALAQDHFKVMVFVGASQSKVTFDAAAALQKMGSKAEYVKISGNGPNALDFHIAYYIGLLAAAEPGAYFHIISKDTGFDQLIQHLKSKNIFAARSKAITDIPLVKAAGAKSPAERMAIVTAKLQQLGASRPRTLKTLTSTIESLFQKQLGEPEVKALIEALAASSTVVVTGTKVSYVMPS
ncbi:MAG: hypothetical protein H0V16_04385 [Burkholderiaceae bacterium]|nr:hypothetical protein [Burkholderiaceae bacterium]